MFVYLPPNWNGLVVVADSRMKRDLLIQDAQGGLPVLEEWGFARAALGVRNWEQTARVCMYDFREDLNALTPENLSRIANCETEKKKKSLTKSLLAGQRASKRAEVLRYLKEIKPRAVVVLQSLSTKAAAKDKDGEDTLQNANGTLCWDIFQAPDSFNEMAGCVWDSHPHGFGPVIPLPNPANNEQVHGWVYRRWLRMALDLAQGKVQPLTAPKKIIEPGQEMLAALTAMIGKPIAVDIEAVSKFDVITALGLSDGHYAVSIPWETYMPYMGTELVQGEQGTAIGVVAKALLADKSTLKILQNHSFDLPFLARHGAPLNGPVADTMAMHKAVPPLAQYRRGLQKIASQLFCVRPWKSLHHPKVPGLTRDDAEFWLAGSDLLLRDYNADDALITWHIAKELGWKCGVKI